MIDVVYWLTGDSHNEVCEISQRSVRKAYSVEETPVRMVVRRSEPGGEPKMLANVRAQIEYLLRAPYGQRVLFLDADVLVLKPLPFFTDLFVTWRDRINGKEGDLVSLMPYNYGVVGVINSPQVVEAWLWLYQRICHMADHYQDWYGNQLALADLVGAAPKEGAHQKTVPIRWAYDGRFKATQIVVTQAPCEIWNYTPETIDEDIQQRALLHFKGDRKDLMLQYAQKLAI